MTIDEGTRSTLAAALGPPLDDEVRGGTAAIRPFPVPGLPEGAVWLVESAALAHPTHAYVGRWPDGAARPLMDDQPAFRDLARAGGVRITDPPTALGYVLGFLEVTRGPRVRVVPVTDPGTIAWRPGTDAEEGRRRAVLADPRLRPPQVVPIDGDHQVDLCLVVDQRIQRNRFRVRTDGAIEAAFEVIASDLPLPIIL